MSSSPATPPLNYYAKYLFAFSPTYSCWSRLTAKDIHTALHQRAGFEGQDIWFYLNHPIKWVRVVGIVVAYDDLENRKTLTVDDGSGYTIDLISWKTAPPGTDPQMYKPVNLDGVELHSVVKVKGSLNEFRGTRQMLLRKVELLKDTNEEVAAWRETTKFKREILSKPWVVSAEIAEREKRKMVGGVEDEQRLRERKRRKLDKIKKQEGGKGDMENFVTVFDQENRWKEHGVSGNELEMNHQRDTGYLGRRRPPQPPLPSVLGPAKSETTNPISSAFKGRRRTTPAPAAPIPTQPPQEPESKLALAHRNKRRVSRPPVGIPSSLPSTSVSTPLEPRPVEIPTNRGRRRISKSPTTLSDSQLRENPMAETSTPHSCQKTPKHLTLLSNSIKERSHVRVPPRESSTYCGRRRATKPRDILTPSFVPEDLPGPVQSPMEDPTYRGQWETPKISRDELIPDPFPEELLRSVQLSSAESLYRGRRRTPKPPWDPHNISLGEIPASGSQSRPEELASTLLTQSSEQYTPPRDLQHRLKTQKNTGRWWELSSPDIQATLPSPMPSVISTYVPSQSQAAEDESLCLGKRREGSLLGLDTQELLDFSDFVPTPASQPTVVGSHRVSDVQRQIATQELLELLDLSDFVPCPAVSVKGSSSFRGRRRNQPTNPVPHSPHCPGYLPPSGNPSQLVSPVPHITPQVSSSSYRGKRRR